ncbi:MAG: GIY-YIG nuclease family protein [Candidatus Moranbacteria bacterium]|nr:GIY-YIG nuclease family protein [Candidatus Moranbacteria bacterium]
MEYYFYILKSLKDKKHYTGISKDPSNRLKQHNSGKTTSTKSRRPFVLIYKEKYPSRIEARNREKYLKSYMGSKEKMEILENIGV